MRDIPILYEDDAVLVINKPAGLTVHPAKAPSDGARPAHQDDAFRDGRTKGETLVDWILKTHPKIKGVGEPLIVHRRADIQGNREQVIGNSQSGISTTPYNLLPTTSFVIDRPGIVHRLDKDTSGVMVIAKTQDAFEFLKTQFQERETEKTYNAFVYGEMKQKEGRIDRPIGRSVGDFRKRSAQRFAKGSLRDAVTTYKVLAKGNGVSYVEAHPKTGRTHQIRVHFKAINHPIVHDVLYASGRESALGLSRLALHARALSLTLPSGERRTFEAPLPEDFNVALQELDKKSIV